VYGHGSTKATGCATELSWPVALKLSKGGSLYCLSRDAGSVGKIRYAGN